MKIWTKSSPTHETGLQIGRFCDWCGSFVLEIWRNSRHENLDEIIAHSWNWSPDSSLLWFMWLFFTIDLKKLSTWKFTKSSPTHETGLQIGRFCDWCGSFVLEIWRNSRHENLDEIIAHSWKWSPDSSLLWMMWLFCITGLKKLSTWKFGRNYRPLMKMVSR